jgi:hypothetical protein
MRKMTIPALLKKKARKKHNKKKPVFESGSGFTGFDPDSNRSVIRIQKGKNDPKKDIKKVKKCHVSKCYTFSFEG